ncbi:MAG: hypothetical protein HRU01_16525, partial [Myxococcales bacterium]|nr:hypothetical protein [Myxococcales bacterium]
MTSNVPLPSTFVEVLHRQAQRTPDAYAYTFLRDGESDEVTLTFGELDRMA